MSYEKIVDRLAKIKALAERGEDMEARVATRMLDEQIRKYGLTLDELFNDESKPREVVVTSRVDRFLAVHVFSTLDIDAYQSEGARLKRIFVRCNSRDFAEGMTKLDFYRSLFEEETDVMLHAFLIKHRLFSANEKPREPTEEEKERLARIFIMAAAMNDREYHKQIDKNHE